MGRTLRYAGLGLVAAAAWLVLAGEFEWLSAEVSETWFGPLAKGGVALVLLGLAASFLGRLNRWVRQGRCVRCGARTEKGQAYCLDHLQASLREVQDRMRPTTEETTRHGGST